MNKTLRILSSFCLFGAHYATNQVQFNYSAGTLSVIETLDNQIIDARMTDGRVICRFTPNDVGFNSASNLWHGFTHGPELKWHYEERLSQLIYENLSLTPENIELVEELNARHKTIKLRNGGDHIKVAFEETTFECEVNESDDLTGTNCMHIKCGLGWILITHEATPELADHMRGIKTLAQLRELFLDGRFVLVDISLTNVENEYDFGELCYYCVTDFGDLPENNELIDVILALDGGRDHFSEDVVGRKFAHGNGIEGYQMKLADLDLKLECYDLCSANRLWYSKVMNG